MISLLLIMLKKMYWLYRFISTDTHIIHDDYHIYQSVDCPSTQELIKCVQTHYPGHVIIMSCKEITYEAILLHYPHIAFNQLTI